MCGKIRLLVMVMVTVIMVTAQGHRGDKFGETSENMMQRSGKFFSLFNIFHFSNDLCNSTKNTKGICYTRGECEMKSGREGTNCAASFGKCCTFEYSCNKMTREKVSYFRNPNFPKKQNGPVAVCSFRVDIEDEDVCQVRLDFLDFHLTGPDDEHICKQDTFTVYDVSGFESLCGKNSGQHIYLPVNRDLGISSVRMKVDIGPDSRGVIWDIQVRQINCKSGDSEEAPADCLQYFSDPSGRIKSFNFEGKKYFQNLNYAICIKRVFGACRVEFEAERDVDFAIGSADFSDPDNSILCDLKGENQDFLLIPRVAVTPDAPLSSLHCGNELPALENPPTTSATSFGTGPIVLQFHTDNKLTDTNHEVGFNLKYSQSSTDC